MQKLKTSKLFLFQLFIFQAGGVLLAPVFVLAKDVCDSTGSAGALNKCIQSTNTVRDIQKIVDFLTYGVAIVIIAAIMLGGVQYALAGDSAEAVAKAKKRITSALVALVAFIFLDAFVQWLVPGGVFK
jgi:hypothetical protein